MTLEVRVLAKGRIGVAGEHFAVRVDVDALVLRGFKEKREVVEVVTRHDDEGAGFHRERDARGFGVAVGFGVGLVEQRHRLEVDAARFHEKAEERVDFGDAADGVERLEVEGVDFVGRVPENAGVVGVGGDPLEPEEKERVKALHVLLFAPEGHHVVGTGVRGERLHFGRERVDLVAVEVDVRERRKERLFKEGGVRGVGFHDGRGGDEGGNEFVLGEGKLGVLAAGADLYAADALGRLFALVAMHEHGEGLLSVLYRTLRKGAFGGDDSGTGRDQSLSIVWPVMYS